MRDGRWYKRERDRQTQRHTDKKTKKQTDRPNDWERMGIKEEEWTHRIIEREV